MSAFLFFKKGFSEMKTDARLYDDVVAQRRWDPSSPYAMQRLIGFKDKFDIAFACDTDHDRHGIVTRKAGLLPPNHYLSVAVMYLFQHRPKWRKEAAIGKTLVST